jgi:hypothetical protein
MADNTLTLDLINDILKGNLNAAENSLHQSLAVKFNDVPAEEEDEDIEISDEELEDAIADEESEEENEEVDDESSEDEEDE